MEINANDVANVINNLIDKRLESDARTFRRGVIAVANGQVADVFVEGNNVATKGILSIGSYQPKVGDKVIILSIGDSGINRLILGRIDASSSSWTQVTTYQNNWKAFSDGNYGGVFYRKSSGGVVSFKGLASSGSKDSDSVMFTMPAGYRPGVRLIFIAPNPDPEKPSLVDILPNGEVRVRFLSSNDWVPFSPISYLAEQ